MINITPTTSYNTNFKAKTDFSKIYREMEKISIQKEEKIIPKVKVSEKFSNRINVLGHKLKSVLSSAMESEIGDIVIALFTLSGAIGLFGLMAYMFKTISGTPESRFEEYAKIKASYNQKIIEQQAYAKADLLLTLLNEGKISYDEYCEQINKIMEEYNVNCLVIDNKQVQYQDEQTIQNDSTIMKENRGICDEN